MLRDYKGRGCQEMREQIENTSWKGEMKLGHSQIKSTSVASWQGKHCKIENKQAGNHLRMRSSASMFVGGWYKLINEKEMEK